MIPQPRCFPIPSTISATPSLNAVSLYAVSRGARTKAGVALFTGGLILLLLTRHRHDDINMSSCMGEFTQQLTLSMTQRAVL